MLGSALFVSGVPMAAVLLVSVAAIAVAVVVSPPASWVVVLAGGVWFYGGLTILRHRRAVLPVIPGLDLSCAEAPGIWQHVDEALGALGIAPPDLLRLTVDARVRACRGTEGLVLAVGLPWLTSAATETVTAIAYAHVCEQAGVGSRKMLLAAQRLQRARELVTTWPLGRTWRPYVDTGQRLLCRAADRQAAAAAGACADTLGHAAVAAWKLEASRQDEFSDYWATNVGPCLMDGFAPPILQGWQYLRTPEAATSPPALDVVPRAVERRLLDAVFPDTAGSLVELDWDRAGDAVWLPRMRHALADSDVPSFTAATLATTIEAPPDDVPSYYWAELIAAALTVTLVDIAGWTITAPLDAPVEVSCDDDISLHPFELCLSGVDGSWDAVGWANFIEEAQIADLRVEPPWSPVEGSELWQQETKVAPTVPQRLELTRPAARGRGYAILALGATFALPLGVAMLIASTHAPTISGRTALLVSGVLVLGGLTGWVCSRLRVLWSTGTVTVTADGAVVEYPALLKEPFQIPRRGVRAVIVDDGDWSDRRRFPVGPTELVASRGVDVRDDLGWLWTKDEAMLVPLLGSGSEMPNVALLLDDPTLAPRVRRVVLSGPIPGEALIGLLFDFAEPAVARSAFAPWGLTRSGTSEDADHIRRGYLGIVPTAVPPQQR